jgi:cysteine desulfurase
VDGLRSAIPGIRVNGHSEHVLPHIVHVTVPQIEGESMVLMLDAAGIEAATGSACSMQDLKPSHVLTAIGHRDASVHGSVRFSLGRQTTAKELDEVLRAFPAIVKKLQGASVLTSQVYARRT